MGLKVVFFGNNALAARVLQWLKPHVDLVALVLHDPDRQKSAADLRRASGLPEQRIFLESHLAKPDVQADLAALRPDLGVSVLFGSILRPPVFQMFPRGCVNLHPALLPWNRGAYPNVWSILDRTPAGATLHQIDSGIDTGPILAQAPVPALPWDTGATLYARLEDACFELFTSSWPALEAGRLKPIRPAAAGTVHRKRDVEAVDRIDLDAMVRAGDLIDLLRARTFPPYRGAYFLTPEGRRVDVRIELTPGDLP